MRDLHEEDSFLFPSIPWAHDTTHAFEETPALVFQADHGVFAPSTNQSLGIMRPMNPLIPSDMFDPVQNMGPYGLGLWFDTHNDTRNQGTAYSEYPGMGVDLTKSLGGVGSVQDAMSVLNLTEMLFG